MRLICWARIQIKQNRSQQKPDQTTNGEYSGQNSLFFPQPKKMEKLISSMFFASFLRRNFSRVRAFRKKSARERFNYQNLSEKGFLMREARKFFRFWPQNCLKFTKKSKSSLKNVKIFSAKELISSRFPGFWENAYLFRLPAGICWS